VAGVALLFDASSKISRFIIEDLPFSRVLRRALSGKNFVEGDWPLVVVYGKGSPEPGKLLYLGFLTIAFRDDELCIYGDDWTPEGVHEVFFESVRSSFHADRNERRLQYFYRQGQTSQDARMRGYTEGYFFPTYEMSALLAGEFRTPSTMTSASTRAGRNIVYGRSARDLPRRKRRRPRKSGPSSNSGSNR
jgi:hypothetical protein